VNSSSGPVDNGAADRRDATAALIPPALRAQLRGLSIIARLPPPAGPLGQNASRQRGQGLEFSQYRAYEPGDEPRHIDWKLYARSDRYFVREAESEAGLAVWVVVDATASMLQADHDAPARSKLAAARALAAAAIEVALRQGDRFGLLIVGGDGASWVPSGRGARHRDRCALQLARLECRGQWPAEHGLRSAWSRIEPSSVVLMIGDGFDPLALEFAQHLATTRRDVRSIALTCVDERDFALRGPFAFEDPETGERIEADSAAAREEFRRRFASARDALQRRLAASGVRHVEHVLDQPLERALRSVLGTLRGSGAGR
jgi:uncharacterized protein (DUF58 family)